MTAARQFVPFFAVLAIASTTAVAQPPAPTDADALRGPRVHDDAPTGAHFDDASRPGRALEPMNNEARRTAAFLRSIRRLKAPDTDPALHLNPTQEREIRAVLQKHQKAMREFRTAHEQDFRVLREQSPRAQGRRDRADTGEAAPAQPPMDPQALRDRMIALREAAPDATPAKEAVWAVLTEPQRQFVQAHVEAMEAEAAARQERAADREPAQGADAPPPQPPNGEARARLRERLESLPPEERRRALERLRQMRRDRGAPTDRPAPSMDDVNVPPPPPRPGA